MNGALIALVGVSGTLAGIIIKAVFDRFAEQGRRDREDVIWRRENALEIAAEFLSAADLLHVEQRTLQQLAEAVVAARQAGHADAYAQHGAQLDIEKAKHRALLERANESLSKLSLLIDQETLLAASDYLHVVGTRPFDVETPGKKAHLIDLMRADLGLPERTVDPATALTPDEVVAKIEEMRKATEGDIST